MATPDFSKIWGKNSPLAPYTFTDDHYLTGWNFVGSTPPARTMFDAWMRSADEKLLWLYENAFSENSLGGFLFWRLPNTAYFVGEKRALQDGPLDIYLECTVAGKTATTELKKLPADTDVGNTLKDGNVTWIVRKFADAKQLDAHRTAAELDHPDGSVKRRHIADGALDADYVRQSKAVISGKVDWNTLTEEFCYKIQNCEMSDACHAPVGEYAFGMLVVHRLKQGADNENRTVQEYHPHITAGAVHIRMRNQAGWTPWCKYDSKKSIDDALKDKVSKSGDTMSGDLNLGKALRFTGGATSAGVWAGKKDTGDPISAQDANLVIGSWYGIAFYDLCEKRIMCGLDVRSGTFRTLGRMEAKAGFTGDLDGSASSIGGYSAKDMRMRASNTSYTVGDIAYSKNLPSWARLECVKAGTTASAEPAQISTGAVGTLIADGTVTWIIDNMRDSTAVGAVRGSLYLPAGYIKANGATVQRADYPRLVAVVNEYNLWTDNTAANAGLFGRGNGSTTMVVPNWIDRMAQYAADRIGASVEAGLPNITGSYQDGGFDGTGGVGRGAINVGGDIFGSYYGHRDRGTNNLHSLSFDASRSSAVYGRSNTVQPPAIKLIPILKY